MPKRISPPRFGRHRKRHRAPRRWIGRAQSWWLTVRIPIFTLIVFVGWWYGIRPITQDQFWSAVDHDFAICGEGSSRAYGCVADGDTLIIGFGKDRRRIRLTGFDTPELKGACDAERKAARNAQEALNEWLARGGFEWDGGEDPPYDQYGRELRAVRRIGSDGKAEYLAETMIARELAAGSGWGSEPVDWCK